ncbi:c-type cytochrome [Bordetella genomosp. 5]|uniref:Cytochrome C n=1 Tax=Bordetella genomosp. 5 TaxID=1395608 RepID=A0A261TRX7_9BORD|nr:c-type cytochrome [Bordetella genomosp. 5]OZI51922.1 cytochrome C [Bordetella genomosp. 5]
MSKTLRIVLLTLASAGLLAGLGGAAAIYFGVYDISATGQHTAPVHRVLDVALKRAITIRAAGIEAPPLDDPGRVQRGLALYQQHCVQCHGAPGVAPQPFALGLNPAPAALAQTPRTWPAPEMFWVIRNGIKMTGMPAWRYRLEDEQIWDVVAFMGTLPELSPADYRKQARAARSVPAADPPAERPADLRAGRDAMHQYLCATCHAIPGVVGAQYDVGPSLAGMANRPLIAGTLPNTPETMAAWLRDPGRHAPGTAMPDLDVSEQDARDMAAFLGTLDKE